MNYTLYIDESGDFESQRGQWVLSGVLFSDSYENCEKFLVEKLKSAPSELDLKSIKQFHLTEFRRDFGHLKAVEMAKHVFNKLNKLPFDYHFIVTINQAKSSLSYREKTYRLMLSDLLSLTETVIPEDEVMTNLDLVVASRTIDGELQTTVSNINNEIINSLPLALEVDLTTRGMFELIGKHINVKMDYANNSWGLVCADFLANLNYHNRKEPEMKVLGTLELDGKYSLFESFGGLDVRRANIAERDKDYVLAVYRWIVIAHNQPDNEKAKRAVQRVLYRLFNKSGTSGQTIAFEALLEKLWRSYNAIDKFQDLEKILLLLESEMLSYINDDTGIALQSYLFRLRNLMLIVENHLGNTGKASQLSSEQNAVMRQLASNPEYFQMILNFKTSEIEVFINSLNISKALLLAKQYAQLVANYKDVWQLLVEQDDLEGFSCSRANIKAEMSLIRCNVLHLGIDGNKVDDSFGEQFDGIKLLLNSAGDISRLNNYKVMYMLKSNQQLEAVEYFLRLYESNHDIRFNVFDVFWFMKSVNDAFLSKKELNVDSVERLVDQQVSYVDLTLQGHPIDLILRELALFEYHRNNKSKALKYIARSKKTFNLDDSEISEWLRELINIHSDHIEGKNIKSSQYFKHSLIKPLPFIKHIFDSKLDMPLLHLVRYYSPY